MMFYRGNIARSRIRRGQFRPHLILITLLVSSLLACADYPSRTWTSVQGKTFEGALVDVAGTSVKLATPEGKMVSIGIRALVKEDKEYLRPIAEAQRVAAQILNQDAQAAEKTVQTLDGMGKTGVAELHKAFLKWFRRENLRTKTSLSPLRAAAARCAKLEQEIIDLQKLARENIGTLAKGEPLSKAREYYDKLNDLHRKASGHYAKRGLLLEKLDRLRAMLELWQDVGSGVPTANEEQVKGGIRAIEEVLGFTADDAEAARAKGGKGPENPRARLLWVHMMSREIEAINAKGSRHGMSQRELANAEMVNHYREILGILPYEYDIRLVKSARGHSKEMVALKYFAHSSPTDANRSPSQRVKNAGYPGGAWENIAYGSPSLDANGAFWMWFRSPPHHANMVHAGLAALGVGEHESRWTQNMGNAKRRGWDQAAL